MDKQRKHIPTALDLFNLAFGPGVIRSPRSVPYRQGVLDRLCYDTGERDYIQCPWREGTPEADAYNAGIDEARQIWHQHRRVSAIDTAVGESAQG